MERPTVVRDTRGKEYSAYECAVSIKIRTEALVSHVCKLNEYIDELEAKVRRLQEEKDELVLSISHFPADPRNP